MWGHKKVLTVLAVVTVAILHPELAHAADGDESETVKSMAELANLAIKFLNTLLWPLLIIIGDLLDVDMITGPGMEERLIAIWVEMRNLVNIAIALVLVVVAFYNVLGLGGGEGELAIKTALPKIVLGLILVNFTYVGGKVILDVANVGTTIAFSLPQIMQESTDSQFQVKDQLEEFGNEVCYPAVTKLDNGTPDDETDDCEVQSYYTKTNAPIQTKLFCELIEDGTEATTSTSTTCPADGTPKRDPGKDEYGGLREALDGYFEDINKNNIAIVMAVNMGSLGSLELFKEGAVENFSDLTVNSIFALVMYAVFAVSYIVLAAVLVVRLVVLWLALALSPVAVLTYVVPQIKEWLGGGGDFAQKVIKHLVAPIIIGLTLSLGFMLMDGWSVISKDSISVYSDSKVSEVISSEFLVSGIDDLPKLILAIASIVVVWMGVFAAANDTYAKGLTEKIEGFGGTVKDALFNAPLLMPMLPISVTGEDKEGMSPMALKTLLTGAVGQFASGNLLPSELDRLSKADSPLVQFALGNGGGERRDPQHNAMKLDEELKELQGETQIGSTKARELAGYLANTIMGSTTMKKEDQKAMSEALMALKTRTLPPSQRELQQIVNTYTAKGYDAKDFNTTTTNLDALKRLEVVRNDEGGKSEGSKTTDKAVEATAAKKAADEAKAAAVKAKEAAADAKKAADAATGDTTKAAAATKAEEDAKKAEEKAREAEAAAKKAEEAAKK